MIRYIHLSTIFISLFILTSSIAIGQEQLLSFKFQGTVSSQDEVMEEVEVRVFDKNELMTTLYTDKKGRFEIELLKNGEYVVEMSKEGYFPKRMILRTNVEDGVKKLSTVKFDAELVSLDTYDYLEDEPATTSILDFPSAIIEYNEEIGDFDYRMLYTKHILEEIKNIGEE